MADGQVILNPGANGAVMDEEEVDFGSGVKKLRSRVVLGGNTPGALVDVVDDEPADDAHGIVVRQAGPIQVVIVSAPPTNFLWFQSTAASVWTITHNLGFYPQVTTVDSTGHEVVGDVTYIDVNTVQVTFSGSFAGSAFMS